MKWYAAQNKVEQASALAIVETLAASCAAVWFAIHYETLLLFAISVLVAPLLLLRTRDSTALGIRWARRVEVWIDDWESRLPTGRLRGLARTLQNYVIVTVTVFCPVVVRVGATIAVLASRRWIRCLQTMPSNWWRLVGRIDLSVAPEPIPGLTGHDMYENRLHRSLWSSGFLANAVQFVLHGGAGKWRGRPDLRIGALMSIPVFIGPVLFYRWSLKSSWWVYCPLLWVISPTSRQPAAMGTQDAHHRLSVMVKRLTEQPFVLIWSGVVVAMCVAKIWLWQMRTSVAQWWSDSSVLAFFKPYIEPDSMPLWQWTALGNGLLAIAMYFAAKACLNAEEDDEPWPPVLVDRGFRAAKIIRRALTVYTIAVMLAITARRGLPPVGEIWPL